MPIRENNPSRWAIATQSYHYEHHYDCRVSSLVSSKQMEEMDLIDSPLYPLQLNRDIGKFTKALVVLWVYVVVKGQFRVQSTIF